MVAYMAGKPKEGNSLQQKQTHVKASTVGLRVSHAIVKLIC